VGNPAMLRFMIGLSIVLCGPLMAFHDGGVGDCSGCHVMHDDMVMPIGPGGEGALLIGESSSDVCLVCHATAAGAVLGQDPLLPPPEKGAGNFVFLHEDNLNDASDGVTNPIPGEVAGHSIVAPAHGLLNSTRYAVAPGGSFPSSQLGCTSCHNPHGNANFRLLHGVGPVQGGIADFTRPAPQAEGISLTGAESNGTHTVYRSGMSAWCGNCHGNYHEIEGLGFEHPTDQELEGEVSAQYNRYNGPTDPAGGSPSSAYLAAVPFEDASALPGSTNGPSGTSRVMCLTCHRAHAASAPHAGRWDFNVSLLREDGFASGSYPIPSPYLGPDQGPLCIKCHETTVPAQP